MYIKHFDFLPQEAMDIRTKVFMEEQGFCNEFDDIDSISVHLVAYSDDKTPIATCRVFKGENDGEYIFGRLAVVKEFRGQNIGAGMIKEAENAVFKRNGKYIILHSQVQAKGFYEKLGFFEFGGIEDDEGCPHIWMRKNLQ